MDFGMNNSYKASFPAFVLFYFFFPELEDLLDVVGVIAGGFFTSTLLIFISGSGVGLAFEARWLIVRGVGGIGWLFSCFRFASDLVPVWFRFVALAFGDGFGFRLLRRALLRG